MHILIVEDDSRVSHYIQEALGREGYSSDICETISEVEAYFETQKEAPELVILDRMLGRQDGATLIPQFKMRFPLAGILILSSLDIASEKARILDQGADEYLAKPFSLEELVARLRLVSRRATGSKVDSSLKVLGNLKLNLKTQNAYVGPLKLDLTRKEFQLLSLFMESPGRVYNRFQILDRVWETERATESNVVETTIKNLRKKLDSALSEARIESKRNMGYWIEA